jgi:hypothetical protein
MGRVLGKNQPSDVHSFKPAGSLASAIRNDRGGVSHAFEARHGKADGLVVDAEIEH